MKYILPEYMRIASYLRFAVVGYRLSGHGDHWDCPIIISDVEKRPSSRRGKKTINYIKNKK